MCDQEEKYVRFHPCLGIIVCLCVHSCPETGPLHSGGVSFFFFLYSSHIAIIPPPLAREKRIMPQI